MYAKLPFGALLALVGVAALPDASVATRVARVLLEVTGIGFGVYLLAASGLLVLGYRLRRVESKERRSL